MNKTNKNIEQLFNEAFADFEKQASPKVWNKISTKLKIQSLLQLKNIILFTGGMLLIIGATILLWPENNPTRKTALNTQNTRREINKEQNPHSAQKTTQDTSRDGSPDKEKNTSAEARGITNEKGTSAKNEKTATEIFPEKTPDSSDTISETETSDKLGKANQNKQSARPEASFKVSDYAGCAPLNVSFISNCKNANSLLWDFDNQEKSDQPSPNISYTQPGVYKVKLTAYGNKTKSTEEILITVYETPKADFTTAEKNITINSKLHFLSRSENAVYYRWSFGDGSQIAKENPVHSYSRKGNYQVKLTVSSENGCKDSTAKTLKVKTRKNKIVFPTAFTPDPGGPNDGRWQQNSKKNDVFHPVINEEIAEYKLKIYNKKGLPVFESSDPEIGWNGYFEGRLMPSEVYVYICTGKFKNGEYFQKKGNLTLIHKHH